MAPSTPARIGMALFVALLALLPATALAQDFTGNASRTTPPFHLAGGTISFDLSHRGDGAFIVLLLDGEGREVVELVRAVGSYDSTRALDVARAGNYMLDVRASGAWTVRVRLPDSPAAALDAGAEPTALAEGMDAGRAAAGGLNGRWVLGGLLAGSVAGPVGLGLAVHQAGSRATPAPPTPPRTDPDFAEGFRRGFEARARTNRRKSAFIGGMVGTAAFAAILIHLLDLSSSGNGAPDPGGGGGPQLRIAR